MFHYLLIDIRVVPRYFVTIYLASWTLLITVLGSFFSDANVQNAKEAITNPILQMRDNRCKIKENGPN